MPLSRLCQTPRVINPSIMRTTAVVLCNSISIKLIFSADGFWHQKNTWKVLDWSWCLPVTFFVSLLKTLSRHFQKKLVNLRFAINSSNSQFVIMTIHLKLYNELISNQDPPPPPTQKKKIVLQTKHTTFKHYFLENVLSYIEVPDLIIWLLF